MYYALRSEMMEFYIGQILLLPYNFAPEGTLDCDGRLLPIQQYTALFSLIGTTYGGNGVQTFALPDLRSCVPVGVGQKPGLNPIQLGQFGGTESVTLTQANLPTHNHTFSNNADITLTPKASANAGATHDPTNAVWANANDGSGGTFNTFSSASTTDASMASLSAAAQIAGVTGIAGASAPVGIRNPYLGLRYVIVMEGIYPMHP